jgi:hypothetical protein
LVTPISQATQLGSVRPISFEVSSVAAAAEGLTGSVVAAANWGIEREEGRFESVLDELRGFLAIGIDISVASSVAVRPLDQRSPAGDPRDRTSGAPRSPTAVYLLSWEREKKEGEKRGRERRERGVLARSAPCLLILRGAWGVRVLEGVGGVER